MVRVAVAVPELVKSEVPAVLGELHPLCLTSGMFVDWPVKLGSTRMILSLMARLTEAVKL